MKESTGELEIAEEIKVVSLDASVSTGDVILSHLLASEKISVERSTGDIKLESTDAPDIYLKTSTGNVTGTLLSEKIFTVNTSTGKKRVPNTTSGGRCEITTSTGNITITIK